MKAEVLRLGNRYVRDRRTSTHLFLTARALGVTKVTYSGQRDEKMEDRIGKLAVTWGGSFKIEYKVDWESVINKWKNKGSEVIHLTVYGLPIQNVISEVKKNAKDKLIIVGGAKVPKSVYRVSDWNISITSQPHSEISALSIFLHELFEGRELAKPFSNAKLSIIPQPMGKKVLKL